MPKPPDNWPAGVLPRGLDAGQAAHYVGLCLTTFLQDVRAGVYPFPHRRGRRTIWDKIELDEAMDRLRGRTAMIAPQSAADPDEEAAFNAMRNRRLGRNVGHDQA